MFCSNCGKEIPEGNRFCSNCGASVAPTEPAVETPVVETPVVETPVVETPVVETPAVQQQPQTTQAAPVDPGASTGKTAFILGIIGLAAGAICSCGCAFLGGILPLVASIVAIVLGNQAKEKSAAAGFENKQAQTAVILGIVGIAVIVVFVIINAIIGAIAGASGAYDSLIYDLF